MLFTVFNVSAWVQMKRVEVFSIRLHKAETDFFWQLMVANCVWDHIRSGSVSLLFQSNLNNCSGFGGGISICFDCYCVIYTEIITVFWYGLYDPLFKYTIMKHGSTLFGSHQKMINADMVRHKVFIRTLWNFDMCCCLFKSPLKDVSVCQETVLYGDFSPMWDCEFPV